MCERRGRRDVMGCTEECVCVGEREREEREGREGREGREREREGREGRERGKKHLPLDFDSFKFAI